DAGAVARRDGRGGGIDRHHDNAGELANAGERCQHVLEHGERQLLPPRGAEHAGETPFGVAGVLDRHHGVDTGIHAVAFAAASALASTWRASSSRSASVVIRVCAAVTAMPSSPAAAASARGTT